MTGGIGSFWVLWQQWQALLEPLVRRRGARLIFPQPRGPIKTEGGNLVFRIDPPILISHAPQKSSSRKPNSRHAIFICGELLFDNADANSAPKFSGASTSVTIYNVSFPGMESVRAELFEAVHFDMEDAESPEPYHPIFHAQRGADNRLDDRQVASTLARAHRVRDECVDVAQISVPGSPYLRLPTPQLDLFSVLTMLIADFFCHAPERHGGLDQNDPTVVEFKALLNLLQGSKNLAREGKGARLLKGRHDADRFASLAHWYAESQSPEHR